jgi:hypothetical protein
MPQHSETVCTLATPIDAFQSWRRELEAAEQEMDRLIAAGLPASAEDRQVRQTRFVALVERREAAARKLLQSDWASRRDKSPRASSRPDAHPNSAAQGGAEVLPDGSDQAETGSGLATSALPTVATDAAILPFVSAAVLSASAPADTAARPTDVVALASDPAGYRSASAATLDVGAPADSGELPTDVAAYAVASIAVSEADIPPARVDATTNDMFATPDVAEVTPFARSSSLSAATTGPVDSADPVDIASHAGPASSDDDTSLMTLLRRLLRGGRAT